MTQLESALSEGPPPRGDRVEAALATLDDEYRAKFIEACSLDFTNSRLAGILSSDSGHNIRATQVQHFRSKLKEGKVSK